MRRIAWSSILGLVALVLVSSASIHAAEGLLYGTIITDDGEELTGRIRWDKNEGAWDDIIDATKVDSDQYRSNRRDRDKRISIFGIDIYSEGGNWFSNSQSELRFGYVDRIIPSSRSKTTVILKNGEKHKFSGGSDLSSSIRELLIDDINEGTVELDWGDIDEIQFKPEDPAYKPSREFSGYRLYGVVETESGISFEGFIQWDVDEMMSTDILDGDQKSKSRKIPFHRIAKIEKVSSRSSEITLTNGSTMKLSGSNDVNSENRGIVVMVPDWGRVKVNWDDFESVTFQETPPSGAVRDYNSFKAPWRLRGTVYTEYGDEHTGEIIWDNDEEFSWEMLNGEYRDMEFDIEFAYIKSIRKRTSSSCEVTLFSGDQFRLRGSNDVNDGNKGVFVRTADDDIIEIDWEEFDRVEFENAP